MTFNLTIVTPKNIYQCSDFRLTYTDRNGHYTDEEAQKILVISTFSWTAMVQFAGVGKSALGFDTTEWLAQLASRVEMNTPLQFIISELQVAGEKYIRSGKHTFTVSGFDGKKPFVVVVSNFQGLPDTRSFFRSPKWTVSLSKQRHLAITTGSGAVCVLPAELRSLGNFARRSPPLIVQQKLAAVNRAVAANPCSQGTVSDSCFTGHLRDNGAGELVPHDVNPGREYLPAFAMRLVPGGMELTPKLDADGSPLPRRLVQMALKRGTTTGPALPALMVAAEFAANLIPIATPTGALNGTAS